MRQRRATASIGSILMIITSLILAVVAASVLFQTSGSLREQSLKTGDQAQNEINSQIITTTITATDGNDMTLELFEHDIKLGPGSNQLRLEQLLITILTYDTTGFLTFRGMNGTNENNFTNGYYTLTAELLGNITNTANTTLTEDYDMDGIADKVTLDSNGQLSFDFSDSNTLTITAFNCSGALHTISGSYDIIGSEEINSISVSGSCGNNYTMPANITVTPVREGEGFFTIEYLRRGNNPVVGNLQLGDVVRLYYESPRALLPDEPIKINIVPKTGIPMLVKMTTPEIISTERVHLYPP